MPCDVLRLSPCTKQPHPLVGHVTGDMKRRESNETLEKIRRPATHGEIIFAVTREVQHGLYTSNLLPTPMLITVCERCSERLAVCHL